MLTLILSGCGGASSDNNADPWPTGTVTAVCGEEFVFEGLQNGRPHYTLCAKPREEVYWRQQSFSAPTEAGEYYLCIDAC